MPVSMSMEKINSKTNSVITAISRLGLSRGIKVVEGVADVHAASTTSSSFPGGAVDVARSVTERCESPAAQGGVKVVFTDEGAKDRFLQEIHDSLVAPAASAVTSAAVAASANKLIKGLLHRSSASEAKEYSITLDADDCNRLYDYAVWSKLEEHNRKQREIEFILNVSDIVSFFAMVVGGALMATGFGFLPGLLLVTLGGLGFVGTALASKPASIIREAVSIEDKAEVDKNPQHYKRRKQILEAIGWLRLLDVGVYVYDRPSLDCKLEYKPELGEKKPVKLVFENDPRDALVSSGILGEFSKKVELDGASKKYVMQLTEGDCYGFVEVLKGYHKDKLDKKARIHAVLAKFVRITASLVGIAGLVLMFIVPPIGSPMVVMSGLLLGGAHWVTDPNKANGGILEKVAGWLKKAHISEVNFMRFNIVFATFSIISGAALMATGAGFAIGLTMMVFGFASLPGPMLFIENAKVISDIDKLSQSVGQTNELTREERRKEEQQKKLELELKVRRHMGVAKIVRIAAILLGIGGVALTFFAPPVGVQMIIVAGVLLSGAHWVIGPGIAGRKKNESATNNGVKESQPEGNRDAWGKIGNWLNRLHTDEVNFMRLSIVVAALSIMGGAALAATGFGLVAGLTMMVFGVATLFGPTLFVRNARVISDKNSLLRPISQPQEVSDVPKGPRSSNSSKLIPVRTVAEAPISDVKPLKLPTEAKPSESVRGITKQPIGSESILQVIAGTAVPESQTSKKFVTAEALEMSSRSSSKDATSNHSSLVQSDASGQKEESIPLTTYTSSSALKVS